MNLSVERIIKTQLQINGQVVTAQDQVTMVGLESVASCLGSPFSFPYPWMPFIGLGQGELGVSSEDICLQREIWRKYGDVYSVGSSYRVHARFLQADDEPGRDYILREVGIFDELVGSKMAVRWLLDEDIYVYDTDDETLINGIDCTCIIWIG